MALRILVIEDLADMRDIIQMTLEFDGYAVRVAANGREGLEAAAQDGPFDLILSDLDMPVMNGIEFMRRYRAEHGAQTPIIALTAEIDSLVKDAMVAGANASISKPFEPTDLLEQVRALAGKESS